MDLHKKYELLEGLSSGGAGTFRARERSSEIQVLVHFLGTSGEAENLMEQVKALPPAAREHIIEFGDHNGRPFVVTDSSVQPLREWLTARQPDRIARAGAWKLPVLPETPAPGSFTQMFQAPPVPAITQTLPVASSHAAPPQAASPAPSAPVEDGEFTRVFRAAAAPPSPAQSVPATDPGGFTRMFQTPAREETFVPRPSSPLVAHPAPLEPAPLANPGEFTRMFQSPAAAPPPQASAPASFTPSSPAAPAGATGAFGGMRAPQPAAPTTGPGQYTSMISLQPPQPPSATLPSSSPALPVAGKKSLNITLLVAIFEGVIILALLLVLFFALNR
jgi:hypothetical protein